MIRIIAAALVAVLAGCAVNGLPPTTPETQSPAGPSGPAQPTAPASDAPEPTGPAAPAWTGHPAEGLAFVRHFSDSGLDARIVVVEADGSLRPVTGTSGGGSFPVWSPDGSRIAYTGPKRGETTFAGMTAVIQADGTDDHQIAEGEFPRWSPDGTRILVQEVDDVTGEDVTTWLADPDTGELTELGVLHSAAWIGNGRLSILKNSYAADGLAKTSLYLMDLATGAQTFVADEAEAVPAPDGSQMLLVAEGTTWLASTDGEPIRELASGTDPVWSQDGQRVAVGVGHDQDANPVWAIVDLDGNVVRDGIVGAYPTFSPDGTRVAVEVYRPASPVVQVIDLASGDVVWEEEGLQPAWRP